MRVILYVTSPGSSAARLNFTCFRNKRGSDGNTVGTSINQCSLHPLVYNVEIFAQFGIFLTFFRWVVLVMVSVTTVKALPLIRHTACWLHNSSFSCSFNPERRAPLVRLHFHSFLITSASNNITFYVRGTESGVLTSSLIGYHSLFLKCVPVEQFCLCSFL
jgi:hypothetical protein